MSNEIRFTGECLGVRLSPHGDNDPHIMVTTLTGDDGEWFDGQTFSSAWLDEMITELQLARAFMDKQRRDGKYGWKFKVTE